MMIFTEQKPDVQRRAAPVIGGAKSDKQSKKLSLGTLPDLRRKNEDKSI